MNIVFSRFRAYFFHDDLEIFQALVESLLLWHGIVPLWVASAIGNALISLSETPVR